VKVIKAIDAGILENPEENQKKCSSNAPISSDSSSKKKDAIPEAIRHLASARHKAPRRKKNFPEADRLRGEIESAGYLVEDTPRGFYAEKNRRPDHTTTPKKYQP
jgi:cysteinyl-tRNA synthetase